jgi:HEAT repeat protein
MKKKAPRTAAELMAELNQKPEVVARQREASEQAARNAQEYARAAASVMADLAKVGFAVENVSELYQKRMHYEGAVPVLMKWLPMVSHPGVKESIVRALSVPFAKAAAPLLIEEYRRTDSGQAALKWAVGNALDAVADDAVLEDMIELARDRSAGKAREMVVAGLGNMSDRRVLDVLVELLGDEEVCGNALMALAKLGASASGARTRIEPFLKHPKEWVRKEARRAIEKIDKAGARLH